MDNLRDTLLDIRAKHGRLTPRLVVAEAENPNHPLHHRFEWDDPTAADKWRLEQAHQLIQSVKLSYRDTGGQPSEIRHFHAVRKDHEYVYEPVDEIASDDIGRRILLADMEREWRTLKRRYQHVREFFDLIRGDIDAA